MLLLSSCLLTFTVYPKNSADSLKLDMSSSPIDWKLLPFFFILLEVYSHDDYFLLKLPLKLFDLLFLERVSFA